MKLFKIIVCIAICILFTDKVNAQVVPGNLSSRLSIGDKVPDITFNLMNSSRPSAKLSDYKGKLVILDFWFEHCGSCVEAMPHMQELQDYLKDKIQILLVNVIDKDKDAITRTFTNIKKNRGIVIRLPAAIPLNKQKVTDYFAHMSEPHEIIITPDGKVLAITSAEQITKENLQAAIKGKKVSFPIKDDFLNLNVPIVSNTNFKDNKGIFVSSSLLGYTPNAKGRLKMDESGKAIGVIRANESLWSLYNAAYPKLFSDNPVLIFKTSNPVLKTDGTDPSKLFTYDIIFQPGQYSEEKVQKCIAQDLDRAFDFSFEKSKQSVPCLIIKTNNNIAGSYTKYQQWENNVSSIDQAIKNHVSIYAHKMGIASVVGNTITQFQLFNIERVIDETGDSHEIDMDFPADFDFKSKEKVLAFLHGKGIDLTVENRELDCVIVSDKKPGEPTVLSSK